MARSHSLLRRKVDRAAEFERAQMTQIVLWPHLAVSRRRSVPATRPSRCTPHSRLLSLSLSLSKMQPPQHIYVVALPLAPGVGLSGWGALCSRRQLCSPARPLTGPVLRSPHRRTLITQFKGRSTEDLGCLSRYTKGFVFIYLQFFMARALRPATLALVHINITPPFFRLPARHRAQVADPTW
eukprot:COSAG06_NODE_1177_length_10397_cov_13.052821_2_plen_183_part_00